MSEEETKFRNSNKSTGKMGHKKNKKNIDQGRKIFIQELISKVEREQSNPHIDKIKAIP